MRISKVYDDAIVFDNGNKITYDHNADCCECNYADFSVLTPDNIYYNHDFNESLQFKIVDGMGFKFGDGNHWIFIPCYSEQNGYYSSDVDIYYTYVDKSKKIKRKNKIMRTEQVLNVDCQMAE